MAVPFHVPGGKELIKMSRSDHTQVAPWCRMTTWSMQSKKSWLVRHHSIHGHLCDCPLLCVHCIRQRQVLELLLWNVWNRLLAILELDTGSITHIQVPSVWQSFCIILVLHPQELKANSALGCSFVRSGHTVATSPSICDASHGLVNPT